MIITPPSVAPWHWRSLPLENRSGSHIFDTLFRHPQQIGTLLESPVANGSGALARYSICAGAPRCVGSAPQLWTPGIGQILPMLRDRLSSAAPNADELPPLPFTGGWLGWLGYDLAWEIERLPTHHSDPLPFPVAYWYEPDQFAVLDHVTQHLWLAATQPDDLNRLEDRLAQAAPSCRPYWETDPQLLRDRPPLRFWSSQADYEAQVRQAKAYIQAGDIFQANLSLRFETQTELDSWSIYCALQYINPSPFASYWQTPWGSVISCSPERLVQFDGTHAQTRPIAGTRPRGRTKHDDQHQQHELLTSTKDNAEHIMLVDLERNDLGRVCEWGSVNVDELLVVEYYSHVMHLVSNVKGVLKPTCDAIDLIRAMFPGGTITGCPKVRCMELIEMLEPTRRSLFYGSCGYLDWRGHLDLNILIRTLLSNQSTTLSLAPHSQPFTIWGQVGAGIVADSVPELEWYESLHKANAQLAALSSSMLL